ncbi:MAG TPA: trigger factor [Tissierellaceae bacterium]
MKAVFEKRENNTVSFNFEIEAKEFNQGLNKAYNENKHYFQIPGFRKGKAPRQIIELTYGSEVFFEDAVNAILPEKYEAAVKELELEPVDQPNIDIDEIVKGEPILVKVTVDVKPEVKLGEYKGLVVEETELEVTEEMVNFEIDQVREQNARLVDKGEEAIEEGDIANIDYKGFVDEVAFEGGEDQGHDLEIGSNSFIPGFEEQLVGKKAGEEVEVKVTFPEEYHAEDLAGKEAKFEVKINNVRVKELPELDDDFAIDVSEFDTLEEYKNDIKAKLEEELKNNAQIEKENSLVQMAVENAEMDLPRGMIEHEIDKELGELDYRLRSQGLDLETYINLTGGDIQALKDQIEPMATERVKANLVLEAIAEEEKIEVTDEDIDNELRKMAADFKAEDVEEFIKDMKKQGDLVLLKTSIANTKVVELLVENAK